MKRTGFVLAALAVMMFSVQALAVETAVMAFDMSQQLMLVAIGSDQPFGPEDLLYEVTQSDTGGYIGETEYWPMDANHVVAVTHLSPIDNDPGRQMDLPDGVWNVITANITINFPGGGDGYVSATDSIFTIVDEPAREGFYTYASECDPIVPTLITRNMAFCAWLCHGSYVIPIECEDPGYYPDPSVLEVTVTNGCDPAETNCNDPECPRIEWSVFQWFKRVRPACQLYLVMTYCVADPGCVCIWRSDFFLPVEMLGFSAVSGQDNMVTLNWATASETNTETFIITRADSRDGLYRTVGSVRASGTTSDRHDYDFVDVGVENGRTYYYKLHTRDLNNNLNVYNIDGQAVVVDATPGAGNDVIRDYHLAQNYPNPFNSQTQFTFHIPAADHVTLKVFDLMGREVATVVNDDMSMGSHTISWDANHLPTGVYMYTMTSGNFSQTNKLLFLK